MEGRPQITPEQLIAALRAEFEQAMRQVAQAVNAAPDGQWIAGSEEPVREVLGEFRRKAYERAVQLRIAAAEAAFSPSGRPAQRPAAAPQGRPRSQRADRQ